MLCHQVVAAYLQLQRRIIHIFTGFQHCCGVNFPGVMLSVLLVISTMRTVCVRPLPSVGAAFSSRGSYPRRSAPVSSNSRPTSRITTTLSFRDYLLSNNLCCSAGRYTTYSALRGAPLSNNADLLCAGCGQHTATIPTAIWVIFSGTPSAAALASFAAPISVSRV